MALLQEINGYLENKWECEETLNQLSNLYFMSKTSKDRTDSNSKLQQTCVFIGQTSVMFPSSTPKETTASMEPGPPYLLLLLQDEKGVELGELSKTVKIPASSFFTGSL